MYQRGLFFAGERSANVIPYDETFILSTLPTNDKTGKAKIQPGRGVKINNIYYWCEAMRDPEVEKKKVDVRYDPFDFGVAYAYIRNRWEKCRANEYFSFFSYRTEREIQTITEEYKKANQNGRKKIYLNAKILCEFAQSYDPEQAKVQREMDREDAVGRDEINTLRPEDGHKAVVHNDHKTVEAVEAESVGSTSPEAQAAADEDFEFDEDEIDPSGELS